MRPEEVIQKIEEELYSVQINPELINFGIVESVEDEIVKASGLFNAGYNEEIEFEDRSLGFILNIDEDCVSIVLLKNSGHIVPGMKVKSTGKVLNVAVSDKIIRGGCK